MRLLAIETSSEACSAALQDGEVITERYRVEPREHTRILLPMIRELLDERSLTARDLDAVVLGNGPGSFIGMRISASVAQGLCYGAALPLVPVSSLAAIAAEVMEREKADKVAVAQDARMNEVYFAAFAANDQGLPVAQASEAIVPVDRRDLLRDTGWTAAGGGWQRYPHLAAACSIAVTRSSAVIHPRAAHVLRIGVAAWRAGQSIDAERLQPAYLRTKVAEPVTAARR
ncbi:MAG TPA: tRNA (adenosine(37)-N6)-threonylcarbamoyltransferase complex dimerization subunit type 1 TsaB [Woeseiaceae bacterium]|jgi:tRNA threonylcarbamoyladenosine biosynthesis protein TsaB